MRTHIYAVAVLSIMAAAPIALAQGTPSPLTEAGVSNTCDQFKLSFQDLADCRTQWGAATTDSDRQRVRNTFAARGGVRGSSTPPVTQTVVPGAGLSTGGIVGAVGATPSSPTGIAPQAPATSTLTPSAAPTPSAVAPSSSSSSTAIPAAPSPAIRTPPPPVAGSPGAQ